MVNLPDSPLKTKPLRIFVVEDHEVSAEYLRLFLEARGHSVVCVHTMREALEKLPQAECDVLLCDVFLPDGSGWDLPSLVDQSFSRPTVAVAMSANVRTESHLESEEAGFLHHLDKPLDPEAL
ncbi:MAG: response regulator, partial [Rhodospirillales bacterium]|nr:response regulator [Acetobacter sp.]